ncbi:MAG: C4-dicarboxylate transporter DcuC [Ignavibacteria bacterium]|nr:C4-dicarboxylate transporter DcuC [Ignavibacteria bacterium]MBK6419530.1 C4-dicarboxylate transporter DcuC [Ignavibacteria bacterium]MBK7413531.1 C4-dicarboxylate transporter DcuC [Ignavibacteria bacterium]
MNSPLIAAILITTAALLLIRRGVDVRFVLIVAGLIMATIIGTPWVIWDTFQKVLGRGDIIGPICTAMGYAFVLKATGCDRDMVRLLVQPLRKVRWLLVPGGVAIGFVTNMAITSQTASAAAVGPILIPLMIASGYAPLAAAGTLLLGCSVGGNLFNPGEPDIVAIRSSVNVDIGDIVNAAFVPNMISFVVATIVLTLVIRRMKLWSMANSTQESDQTRLTRATVLRALLPPLPILILLLLQPRFGLFPSIAEMYPQGVQVSAVMLLCSGLVMLVTLNDPRRAIAHISRLTIEFFEGLGFAFAKVISLILAAACFLAGLEALGAIAKLTKLLTYDTTVAAILSPVITWGLAVISGSGTAPSVAFSQAVLPGVVATGAISAAILMGVAGAIGAGLGRTMSPVSAIMLFTSTLAEVEPKALVKLVTWPILASLVSTIIYGLVVS